MSSEQAYLDLLREVYKHGLYKDDRTKTGTKSLFGRQIRFDIATSFPLLTTKKMFLKGIIYELLWFLRGESNIRYLVRHGVHIWDEWPYKRYCASTKNPISKEEFIESIINDKVFAKKWGDLGPVYGVQWRKWKTPEGKVIDQVHNAVHLLQNEPTSRRIIISAWNPGEIDEIVASGGLPPCHTLFQLYVNRGKLSCHLYQRSADLFLGVPFNIASYALLTMMFAQVSGLEPGEFIHTFGDVHIYSNHLEQVQLQLSRKPYPFPRMEIQKVKDINSFRYTDFQLVGYRSHPSIAAPVAV